jgi:hypothetical protein
MQVIEEYETDELPTFKKWQTLKYPDQTPANMIPMKSKLTWPRMIWILYTMRQSKLQTTGTYSMVSTGSSLAISIVLLNLRGGQFIDS